MQPADIQRALKARGITKTAIGRQCGVGAAAVHSVIQGEGLNKRIAEAISIALQTPRFVLFPQWYSAPLRSALPEGQVGAFFEAMFG